MTKEQVINDVLLAAQPTKEFVTVEQVAALAVFLCSDAAVADHRRQHSDRRRLDGRVTGRQRPGRVKGLAGPRPRRRISLALQGGGAHGAFTWGVLDALLEDGRLDIEAITGTSAGAMNAVVLGEGWLEGGRDGARSELEAFWRAISVDGRSARPERAAVRQLPRRLGARRHAVRPVWLELFAQFASPYEINPLDINPLRDMLATWSISSKVRACDDDQALRRRDQCPHRQDRDLRTAAS